MLRGRRCRNSTTAEVPQDLDLQRAQQLARRAVGPLSCMRPQCQDLDRDGQTQREEGQKRLLGLELTFLDETARLQGFVALFDQPACSIGVDDRGDVFGLSMGSVV